MVAPRFNRSYVHDFSDLSEEQQKEVRNTWFDEDSDARGTGYVLLAGDPLPLSMFMRVDSPVWDGVYGTSAFSAYFVKFSKCGTEVVVAEKFT